jgi:hypothetical protein
VLKISARACSSAERLVQSGIHRGRYFFLHCIRKEEGIDSPGDFGESKNRFLVGMKDPRGGT